MAFSYNPDFTDINKLREWTENVHEKYFIELKKASGNLPVTFWDSYSSFCNTSGGWIILGVIEDRPKNRIIGVGNAEKITADLWNLLSNRQKVSYRVVENQDIRVVSFPEGDLIYIHVREVSNQMKPVYINDRQENTWIRTGDGDRLANKEELAALLRNAQPALDNLPADNFGLDDLDEDSVIVFKEMVSKRYPSKQYLKMTNEKFLIEIGACLYDRENNRLKVKKGTILFLGKVNAIKELFPRFHVDYFNRRGSNERWSDRISDDEPNEYEINIFNFYRLVYEKIRLLLQDSFSVDGPYQLRMPLSDFDVSIRECLVNCLAHADYIQGYPSTKVDAYDGWFSFVNPGQMLVSKEQFITGGDSRPRNEIVMKLFRLLGASERQGFGGPLIYKTAYTNDFRSPEVITDLEHTELHVWNIDLAEAYPDMESDEKETFRYIIKRKEPCSIKEIYTALRITEYRMRQIIAILESKDLIRKIGNGRGTRYTRAETSIEELTSRQIEVDRYKKQLT